jgi:PAS domain S-box-containing protein
MMPVVPKAVPTREIPGSSPELGLALASMLEFLGASAGWIGLRESGGGMTFPVCQGTFADNWLRWQQPGGGVWGIALGEGPILLNDLQPWPALGDPPLRNFLSCPLVHGEAIIGHIALANKSQGFSPQDAAVLQAMAHYTARLLERPGSAVELPAAWRRLLDHAAEGILVLDESGVLVHANRTWLNWTGFAAEELLGRRAPFPFWVDPADLGKALSMTEAGSAGALPFRRRDQSLLWCQVETETEHWAGRPMVVTYLRQWPAKEIVPAVPPEGPPLVSLTREEPSSTPTPNWLPLLLELGGGIEGWGPHWENLTGLSSRDVEGSRSELVLDWLFPQQPDRERVADCFHRPSPARCQLLLEVAAPAGSRPLLCTFYPLPEDDSTVARRWLLLIAEPEPAAAAPVALPPPRKQSTN